MANSDAHNVLQFNGLTGEFVCIFAESPPEVYWPLVSPIDLAWLPNGNLAVTWFTYFIDDNQFISEHDGTTGAFIQYIIELPHDNPNVNDSMKFHSMTIGGPTGIDFFVQHYWGSVEEVMYRYDGLTKNSMGVAIVPTEFPEPKDPNEPRDLPFMLRPDNIRMNSDGFMMLAGEAELSPRAILRRYGYNSLTGKYELDAQLVSTESLQDFTETPDGQYYLACNRVAARIDRLDRETLAFVDIFVPFAPFENPSDPAIWTAMREPYDLQFGPNGNLYVLGYDTAIPTPDGDYRTLGQIHEFNGQTGQHVQVFGGWSFEEPYNVNSPNFWTKLRQPQALEFKPYPGDFASAGGSFHGDWVIDEHDRTRFIAALDGTSPGYLTGANLLSFDMNRDGIIDCADWPLFAAAFEASSGYAPEVPGICDEPTCAADLAGNDNTVDVFDLFELLSNWSTNGPGANLAPDTNVIDVFDLFALLSAWGECN